MSVPNVPAVDPTAGGGMASPMAVLNPMAMMPQSNAMKTCSYCFGDSSGGPPGHLYRSCLRFIQGMPSLNPKWNYQASGPDNFRQASVPMQPMQPMMPQQMMMPNNMMPNMMHAMVPQYGQANNLAMPTPASNDMAYVMTYLKKLEAKEVADQQAAVLKAQKEAKAKEWEATVKLIEEKCSANTTKVVEKQMSPVCRCLQIMEKMDTEIKKKKEGAAPDGDDEAPKRRRITNVNLDSYNTNKDSLFVFNAEADVSDPDRVKVTYMCELMAVTTKTEWEFWVAKRLDEQSDRAVEMLREICHKIGVDPKRSRSQSSLQSKIAEHFDKQTA